MPMYGDFAQDLALFHCCGTSSWEDIKSSYRKLVRRLHTDLQNRVPGANDRWAEANAAYDRLRSKKADTSKPSASPKTITIELASVVQQRLRESLRKWDFKQRFEMGRDAKSGVYQNPRRLRAASDTAALAHASRVSFDGSKLIFDINEAPQIGQTALALPSITMTSDGRIQVGSANQIVMVDFSYGDVNTQVRSAQVQFSGLGSVKCLVRFLPLAA